MTTTNKERGKITVEGVAGASVAIAVLAVCTALVLAMVFSPSQPETVVADQGPRPTAALTSAPGPTVTTVRTVRRDGRTLVETQIAYRTVAADGSTRLVRQTIRETAPGERVTSVRTLVVPGPEGPTRVVIGPTTTDVVGGPTETQVVSGPVQTQSETVTERETLTETVHETVHETVRVTETQPVTERVTDVVTVTPPEVTVTVTP